MWKLHIHLTNNLVAQSEHIKTISTNLLTFKLDMERDFTFFHDQFQVVKANI